MSVFEDQLYRKIELRQIPQRIISLVPSQTELLYHLGLADEVVGITKFCVHPQQWHVSKPKVGGTKNIDIEKIKSLRPGLIIANKEENVKEQIEALANEFPVWVSDVHDLSTAYEMMLSVGSMAGRENEAKNLVLKIKELFDTFKPASVNYLKTAYLIWRKPYMSIGGDTFIHQMLLYNGFENVFANQNRYPEIKIAELAERQCELVLLSSEPYPFKQKHIEELKQSLPNTKIFLVNGELFSWYGSRLLEAPHYFKALRQNLLIE